MNIYATGKVTVKVSFEQMCHNESLTGHLFAAGRMSLETGTKTEEYVGSLSSGGNPPGTHAISRVCMQSER